MRFIKPLDEALLQRLSAEHEQFLTLEENAVQGGAGSAVNEWLAARGTPLPVRNLGLPDRFIHHGTQAQQLAEAGLDAESLLALVRELLA
jgi:1-deoxy-D-xylulose-5-phosphate synthase